MADSVSASNPQYSGGQNRHASHGVTFCTSHTRDLN